MELSKTYNPKKVENKIYTLWLRTGFFNPDKLPGRRKKIYTIVIPPPNITGELHMGQTLNATTQDILIRWKRLQGFKTLWVPGIDHGGISTQYMVEKELKKEGKTRFDLGREKFIKRVWLWREKYGDIILEQFKKIGCSLNWSRIRFTLDKDYVRAVETAFLHYYKKGWIYQGERTVNWCSRCGTSLSDLEVTYKEEPAFLYYIKYGPITIATVRPETKLGDTAVAVNPKDKRYKKYIGKTIEIKTVLGPAKMKVIGDKSVDMDFGTGAMKVTPAHDIHDFELGEKHGLERKQVIGSDGKMTKLAQKYAGLTVREARKKIVKDMKRIGILEKVEPYTHNVARCYRCNTILEPILSKQWFLKMAELAKVAIKAVKTERVKFIPKNFEKIYFDWLKNIKDWCISRQLWWGIRIPVWHCGSVEKFGLNRMGFHEKVVAQVFAGKAKTYRLRDHFFTVGDRVVFDTGETKRLFGYGLITNVHQTTIGKIRLDDPAHGATYQTRKQLIAAFKRHHPEKEVNSNTKVVIYTYKFSPLTAENTKRGCGQVIVSLEKPKHCPFCRNTNLVQSPDTLDTWFSSALWPFATLGWPKKTKDLKIFYPTNVLSTGPDIINLWVTRMIFSGLEFMADCPFKDVYIHPMVLTREGKRMSKSLGTGVNPVNLIEKYGADATRFGIAYQVMGGQDIRFVEDNILMGKKFCNKIWNASRFVLLQIGKSEIRNPKSKINSKFTKADKKILKALNKTVKSVNKDLDNFQFGKAAHTLYSFFWHDFCDLYIEQAKSEIRNPKSETKKVLLYVLLTSLKLLHPFIPFITEEIYQKLPIRDRKKCLMVEDWPK